MGKRGGEGYADGINCHVFNGGKERVFWRGRERCFGIRGLFWVKRAL